MERENDPFENLSETNDGSTKKRKSRRTTSIIQAMDIIVSALHRSGISASAMKEARPGITYLKKHLNVSQVQAIFLSILCDAGCKVDYSHFASYLGCQRILLIRFDSDLQELVHRGIISRIPCGECEDDYLIRKEAMNAYQKNLPYERPSHENCSVEEFYTTFTDLMRRREIGLMTYDDFNSEVCEFFNGNPNIPLVKELKRYSLDTFDRNIILSAMYNHLCYETSIGQNGIRKFLDNSTEAQMAINALMHENSNLIDMDLITSSCDEGFMSCKEFVLTEHAKDAFLQGYTIEAHSNPDPRKGLRHHEKITAKALFYNTEEQQQIKRLADLLQEENLKGIQKRLEEQGMRKGFTCLFYGAPGTGKTETVFQLARLTGRDIFEVSIAGIRDKYVGESENRIKEVFTNYRLSCSRNDIAPILLFNEADAIINKRTQNIAHSIDKMDNAIQDIILEELEKLDGILIATTNLTCNMDSAFERRFLYKIEFKKPTSEVKSRIWKSMIPSLTDNDANILSKSYDFSGGEIENISRKITVDSILYGNTPNLKQIREFCDRETISKQQDKMHNPINGFSICA